MFSKTSHARVHGNDSSNVRGALNHRSQHSHNLPHHMSSIRGHSDQPVKIDKFAKADESMANRSHMVNIDKDDNSVRRSTSSKKWGSKLQNNSPTAKYPELTLQGDKKVISATN